MANVDGEWDVVTKSPIGDQRAVLTVRSDGDTFTGNMASPLGALDDTLIWTMDMKAPFPMLLTCKATVSGDSLEGGVTAGAFGTSPITGTRKA
jgi:hypothetical protein